MSPSLHTSQLLISHFFNSLHPFLSKFTHSPSLSTRFFPFPSVSLPELSPYKPYLTSTDATHPPSPLSLSLWFSHLIPHHHHLSHSLFPSLSLSPLPQLPIKDEIFDSLSLLHVLNPRFLVSIFEVERTGISTPTTVFVSHLHQVSDPTDTPSPHCVDVGQRKVAGQQSLSLLTFWDKKTTTKTNEEIVTFDVLSWNKLITK